MTDIDFDAVIAELRKGWTKGPGANRLGTQSVCLLGAVNRVAALPLYGVDGNGVEAHYHGPAALEARKCLLPIIREQFPERAAGRPECELLWMFNDHQDTTLDDVILVCEKARAAQGEIR